MEQKKTLKINLSTFLLILAIIAIIVMGVFIYKLNNDKTAEVQKSTELQAQVNTLNGTVSKKKKKINNISETIDSSSSNTNTNHNTSDSVSEFLNSQIKEKDYDDIVLSGHYAIPGTDNWWDFTEDGKAGYSGNISFIQGTYKTIEKNSIEIHYTKSELWDEETYEVKISNIDEYEYLTVDDNKNIYWIHPDGEKVKLQRYGEAITEYFE